MKRPQTIFRVDRASRDFTTISNALLRDQRVSHETRGLLCDLLSRPLDWEICVSELIAKTPSGREKIYRMLKEAERFGYITRDQARRDNGTMGKHYYVVTDRPESRVTESRKAADRVPENRNAAEPDAVEPLPANPPQQRKESNKGKKGEITTSTATNAQALETDDEGIRGAGFALSWAIVDQAAALQGVPVAKARGLAGLLALEWLTTPPKAGASIVAIFRRALREEAAGGRAKRPLAPASAPEAPHWRDRQRAANEALAGAIERARAREVALQ